MWIEGDVVWQFLSISCLHARSIADLDKCCKLTFHRVMSIINGKMTISTTSLPHFKTPVFEGPLDLLLHLIRVNEVDIYDIPIAEITEQYLVYMERMEALDLAVAGEYLVLAATLIEIKSRML